MDDRLEAVAGGPAAPAQVVDAAEVEEEVVLAAGIVPEKAGQRQPVLRPDLDRRQIEIEDLRPRADRRGLQPLAELLRRRRQGGGRGDRHVRLSAAKRAERESRDFSPDAIFFWSSRIAWISSSGVGGQPGT